MTPEKRATHALTGNDPHREHRSVPWAGIDLMLFLVGHRRGYSVIFWRAGKFAGAQRHVVEAFEDFLDSLDTILRDVPDEIVALCD